MSAFEFGTYHSTPSRREAPVEGMALEVQAGPGWLLGPLARLEACMSNLAIGRSLSPGYTAHRAFWWCLSHHETTGSVAPPRLSQLLRPLYRLHRPP